MNDNKIYIHFNEIKKSINSCTNRWQLESCERMIDTFSVLHKEQEYDDLLVELWDTLSIKQIKLK